MTRQNADSMPSRPKCVCQKASDQISSCRYVLLFLFNIFLSLIWQCSLLEMRKPKIVHVLKKANQQVVQMTETISALSHQVTELETRKNAEAHRASSLEVKLSLEVRLKYTQLSLRHSNLFCRISWSFVCALRPSLTHTF